MEHRLDLPDHRVLQAHRDHLDHPAEMDNLARLVRPDLPATRERRVPMDCPDLMDHRVHAVHPVNPVHAIIAHHPVPDPVMRPSPAFEDNSPLIPSHLPVDPRVQSNQSFICF